MANKRIVCQQILQSRRAVGRLLLQPAKKAVRCHLGGNFSAKILFAAIFSRNLQFFYPGASKNAANPFSETQADFLSTCSKFHLLEVPARWRCSCPSKERQTYTGDKPEKRSYSFTNRHKIILNPLSLYVLSCYYLSLHGDFSASGKVLPRFCRAKCLLGTIACD